MKKSWWMLLFAIMPALLFGAAGIMNFFIKGREFSAWCFTGAAVLYALKAYGDYQLLSRDSHHAS